MCVDHNSTQLCNIIAQIVIVFFPFQRVLEENQEHYHIIQKFIILGDVDGEFIRRAGLF